MTFLLNVYFGAVIIESHVLRHHSVRTSLGQFFLELLHGASSPFNVFLVSISRNKIGFLPRSLKGSGAVNRYGSRNSMERFTIFSG